MVKLLRCGGLLLLLCLAGCTRWQYQLGEPVAESVVAEATDLTAALRWLGPPHRIAADDQGYILAWEYWLIREESVGLSLGAVGAELLSFDWGEAKIQGEFLLLGFDRNRQLTGSAFTAFDSSAGGGLALQPALFSPDLTNVDDLVSRMPQHTWGAAWLNRLPRALNSASDPDLSGRSMEQRGTPVGIGQRTLEMN